MTGYKPIQWCNSNHHDDENSVAPHQTAYLDLHCFQKEGNNYEKVMHVERPAGVGGGGGGVL